MKKIKITIMTEVEFVPNADFYPKSTTIEQILAIEIENAENDPVEFMELNVAKITVAGEVLNEKHD